MRKVIFLLLVLLEYSAVQGQNRSDSVDIYLIETTDGNQYTGQILDRNSDYIRMKTDQLGEIRIKVSDIRKFEIIRREFLVREEYWLTNPLSIRYFFSGSGYGLESGEGYYQNAWVFFNQISIGLTENLSIGAGMMPLFLIAGTPTPVWFTPKISIPVSRNKINLGTGALIGTVIGEEDATFGVVYGVTSFGSRDRNVSLGIGYGLIYGEWADFPAISFSTMIRYGKRAYFISDNYLFPSEYTVFLISFGGRSILQNIAIDYGFILPFEEDMYTFIALPWLGITVPFGKKKD